MPSSVRAIVKAIALLTSLAATAACTPFVKVVHLNKLTPAERSAALQVQVYPLGTAAPAEAKYIGPVEAYSCKLLLTDPPASKGDALQQLQVKALRRGANAVGNVTFDTRGTDAWGTNCWNTVEASGIAMQVPSAPIPKTLPQTAPETRRNPPAGTGSFGHSENS